MDTTLDEARRCPKCEELGTKVNERNNRDRSRDITFVCHNKRCKWHGQTCRVVTVRPDGTIPEPRQILKKSFPSMGPDRTEAVQASLDKQLLAERDGRGEIRGR